MWMLFIEKCPADRQCNGYPCYVTSTGHKCLCHVSCPSSNCSTCLPARPPPAPQQCTKQICQNNCACIESEKHEFGRYCHGYDGYLGRYCQFGKIFFFLLLKSETVTSLEYWVVCKVYGVFFIKIQYTLHTWLYSLSSISFIKLTYFGILLHFMNLDKPVITCGADTITVTIPGGILREYEENTPGAVLYSSTSSSTIQNKYIVSWFHRFTKLIFILVARQFITELLINTC